MYQKSSWYDLQFLRYRVWWIEIGNYKSFFAPPLLKSQKSRILKKLKKNSGDIIHHFTCVLKTTIRWGAVPEIWSETDIIFCHFGPFFALLSHYGPQRLKFEKSQKNPGDIILLHMCTINEDHMMYGSWDKKTQQIVFCHFRQFCALLHTSLPKKSKFWKKAWKYHLTLKWNKWQSYYVWLLRYGAQKWPCG